MTASFAACSIDRPHLGRLPDGPGDRIRDVMKLQVQKDLATTFLHRFHRPRPLSRKKLDAHLEQRDRGAKLVHELCGSGKVLDIQGHDQSRLLRHDIAPYLN